ncbi:MFS transporter [Streptomyces sp. NPDC048637]|uniref:MFS transporter n=1 Tax=Streptomyces sp. NPDC048637 TaxID=3155636 RepID=UPI00341B5910
MIERDSSGRRIPALWLVLLATPTSLSANTTTTVVPELARSLNVSTAHATWAATAFGWGAVIGTPLTAALLRTRTMRVAVLVNAALVLLGTLLVVLAPGLSVLLCGRACQAAGGSGLVTVAITLAHTPRRTGLVTAAIGFIGAFGPLAGSALAALSWRVALSLSLLALPAVIAVVRDVPAQRASKDARGADGVGVALVAAMVTALVLIAAAPVPALLCAAVTLLLLGAHVRRHRDGFVPQPVLRTRAFRRSSALACALSTTYFTVLYTVPHRLAEYWTAEVIGGAILLALATGSAASLLFATWTSRLAPAAVHTAFTAAGAAAVLLPLTASCPAAFAAATGFAVFASTGGMAWHAVRVARAAPDRYRSDAVALFTLCYQLGGAFGPALAAALIT